MTECTSTSERRSDSATCPESIDKLHCPCRVDGLCCWCGDKRIVQERLEAK